MRERWRLRESKREGEVDRGHINFCNIEMLNSRRKKKDMKKSLFRGERGESSGEGGGGE